MAGKYFTTTVLPDMGADGATTALSTAFTDADILFDWHAFDIPKGANRLLSITSIVHGTDGVDQDIKGGTTLDIDLFFAKDRKSITPPTLGVNNAVVTGEGWYNHIIGRAFFDSSVHANDGDLIRLNIGGISLEGQQLGGDAGYPLVLQGDNDPSYIKDGYDRIYVAGIAKGAFDFNTGVLINMSGGSTASATATLVIDGTDVRNVFAVGDVIVAQDGAAVGTIKSMTHDGTDGTIVLESAHTDALGDDDELFHQSPIRLIMAFER
jgi:hypothetical protein